MKDASKYVKRLQLISISLFGIVVLFLVILVNAKGNSINEISLQRQEPIITNDYESTPVSFDTSSYCIGEDLLTFVNKIDVQFDTIVCRGTHPGSGTYDTTKVTRFVTADGYEVTARQSISYPTNIEISLHR
ncbi:MAG: hypothetical protein MUD00_00505 [Candidatus Pacebacteria bacterium]|jgi:hypothetical protein|nr:hypothetical protein [Candidatus Paceibacterota bacterium]